MNKVICDVCGTKYPETSEQCPICGCAKPENARIVSGDSGAVENDSVSKYAYVKGGRFSKSNVRKRNKAAAAAREIDADLVTEDVPKEKEKNTGLVIAVIALLLAVLATMLFIFFKYFMPVGDNNETQGTAETAVTTTVPTTTETEDTTLLAYPCEKITLSTDSIQLDEIGDSWLLSAEVAPLECTDVLSFTSADPSVADVTDAGRVTAISAGETVITVTCGEITEVCTVYVTDASATTVPPTEESTEATVSSGIENWKLNREDITFTSAGDSWLLYKGDVDTDDITWTSDDPSVATFEKGIVTAVAPGMTKVHAEYNGTKYNCIIRCKFDAPATEDTTPSSEASDPAETTGATETTEPTESAAIYTVYIDGIRADKRQWGADVTIRVGESFQLTLRTENNDIVAVTWAASKENVCTIEGNKITGNKIGTTEITVNYAGEIYKCAVTVQ